MPYGGGMRLLTLITLAALGLALGQGMPDTYTPLVLDLHGAVQVECADPDLTAEAACFDVTNSASLVRTSLNLRAIEGELEWLSAWQQHEEGITGRLFAWRGEQHLAMVFAGTFSAHLILVPASAYQN